MEAAFIVPVSWICAGLLIALNFYIHDAVWYQAAAFEAALAGNGREGEDDPGELTEKKLALRMQDKVMPGDMPDTEVTVQGSRTEVAVKGHILTGFAGEWMEYQVAASVEKIRPVEYIRKMQAISGLLEGE